MLMPVQMLTQVLDQTLPLVMLIRQLIIMQMVKRKTMINKMEKVVAMEPVVPPLPEQQIINRTTRVCVIRWIDL